MKKISTVVSMLAVLTLASAAQAEGAMIDPNGGDTAGSFMDPNGCGDSGGGMDPNGGCTQTNGAMYPNCGDSGGGMDPNGGCTQTSGGIWEWFLGLFS